MFKKEYTKFLSALFLQYMKPCWRKMLNPSIACGVLEINSFLVEFSQFVCNTCSYAAAASLVVLIANQTCWDISIKQTIAVEKVSLSCALSASNTSWSFTISSSSSGGGGANPPNAEHPYANFYFVVCIGRQLWVSSPACKIYTC